MNRIVLSLIVLGIVILITLIITILSLTKISEIYSIANKNDKSDDDKSDMKIALGTFVTDSIAPGENKRTSVQFPFTFSSTPHIFLQVTDSWGQFTTHDVEEQTPSGFLSYCFVNPSTSGGTKTYSVKYIAIGPA